MLVDGGGRLPGVQGKHLGRAPGWRQQDRVDFQFFKGAYYGGNRSGFSGAGIAVYHQDVPIVGREKTGGGSQKLILAGRRFIGEAAQETVVQEGGAGSHFNTSG